MQRSVLLIGGGRMGRAFAQGMIHAGVLTPEKLTVADHNQASRAWWQANIAAVTLAACPTEITSPHDIVILAIKPHHLAAMISQVRRANPKAWHDSLVVSVATGITLESLCDWIGSERIARVMPNTPSLVATGVSGFCCSTAVSEAEKQDLAEILAAIGMAIEVPEYQLDAVTGLSGSGPAYVFMFIEALADGGVMAGLPRDKAMKMAAQTVMGAAKMVLETGQHPGELKDAVASPGGTTIAAIRTLEHNAFRGAVIDAVMASTTRSREISQG